MAEFRIDQGSTGTAGQSRHDLSGGSEINLVVTDQESGATYEWELVDAVGSTASITPSGGGETATLGPAGDIASLCAFLIQLTKTTSGGAVTTVRRIASVRGAGSGLRPPLFSESAPQHHTLLSNTPDDSTDNAVYSDRAGLGSSSQNWRGWAEWGWEVTEAIEDLYSTPAVAHASTHIEGGSDEINGDRLAIDFSPTNYTPDIGPAQVDAANQLTAHLAGINTVLADVGGDLTEDDVNGLIDKIAVLPDGSVGTLPDGTVARMP